MLKRLSLFILAALFALPLAAGNFAGTISPAGYSPPPGATVKWCRFGRDCKTFPLNPAIPWNDANDLTGKLCRYAACDPSVVGMETYPAVGSEHGGGENGGILIELFREAGVNRLPNVREFHDFAFANFPGRIMACCADFARIVGRPRPGCVDSCSAGGGADELRLQPDAPPGCCRRTLPCVVELGLEPGAVKQERVLTPQGGRRGCFLIQPARASAPVEPLPPLLPVTPPAPPPAPVAPPPAPRRCVLVIFQEGAPPSAIETPCPP